MWVDFSPKVTQRRNGINRMEIPSFCLFMSATLSVYPDRPQFFRYETFSLSCSVPGGFDGWAVKRNTSSGSVVPCEVGWGRSNGSSCTIKGVYSSDSGLYWCQSERGECSNVLNITVNTGDVIMESPAHPVTEGQPVTLHCFHKERYGAISTSGFNATFYKDGVFIGIHTEGKLIIPSVSKSDEGLYKCGHPTQGESPQSFLAVTDRAQPTSVPPTPPPPHPPIMTVPRLVCFILLFVFYTAIMILCVCIYRKWAQVRADAKRRRSPNHLER
ncbi:Fc receptor-like protein 4 [Lates calcarifer]|uniref:Fc receptor-like protein 4 n=1 Tax=Lates calcarifer TaxID=8187 RepID=A0AAJ7V904_LATCA|nr:Fc receptor-like protein 4 [Lates calcarifer]XP_050925527.1 Fc receptor-like protein 4 [Lates calcarifer]